METVNNQEYYPVIKLTAQTIADHLGHSVGLDTYKDGAEGDTPVIHAYELFCYDCDGNVLASFDVENPDEEEV